MNNYFVYHYRSGIWMNGYVVRHGRLPSTDQALQALDGWLEHNFVPQTDYLVIVDAGDVRIVDVSGKEKEWC